MKPVALIIQKLQEQTTDVVKSNKIESPLTDIKFTWKVLKMTFPLFINKQYGSALTN